jgi:hypothetical protein
VRRYVTASGLLTAKTEGLRRNVSGGDIPNGHDCAVSDFGEEHGLSGCINSIAFVSEEGDKVRRPGGGEDCQPTGVCIVVAELSQSRSCEDERVGVVHALVRPAKASPSSASLRNGGEEGQCTGVCTTVMVLTGRSWSHGVADGRALSS